jgi:pentatricopeptide repeat protein
MKLQSQYITIFLALLELEGGLGFLPTSSTRQSGSWGISEQNTCRTKTPLDISTRLPVSVTPTATDNVVDDGEEDEEEDDEMINELLDDDDEEEYDYDELLAHKQEWMNELGVLAHTSAQDATAVTRAQELFDQLFQAYVTTEESTMFPTVDVYNLLMETHAYAKSKDSADNAENILSRMEDPTVEFVARPNLETYLTVMDAWAMRKHPEKAQAVLERLEQRYAETKDESVRPSVEAYNKLIKAHGMAGDVDTAESIFRELLEKEGEQKANYKSWIQTMKAYAPRKDGTEKVQALFEEMTKAHRMGEEEYLPKTEAYNTLIRALGQTQSGAEEAEAMLFDMINQFRNGDEGMRPNADSFRNVLVAHSRRRNNPVSGAKVEHLLQIQQGLYGTTKSEDLKVDARLYNVALGVIARSRDPKKAPRAKRIVEKMKKSQDMLSPSVRSYYTLLSACAYTEGAPDENFAAFQIAVDTLKEMRESQNQDPDSACFGMFLKACANLMPESRKRDAVVENVFRKCCSEGLANDFVLQEFERASSETLQLEMLGGFLDDDVRLPKDWGRNVVETSRSLSK